MATLQRRLGADFGSRVRFVSVTVEPEIDTPAVLTAYAKRYDADLAGWSFLTGSSAEIGDVVRRYGAYSRKVKPGDVDHLFLTSLVDRQGMLRVQYLGYRFEPEEMLQASITAARMKLQPFAWLPNTVASAHSIYTKLLVAFHHRGPAMFIGGVGLAELCAVNQRTEDLMKLERKIAVYRQIQQNTTSQLYSVASAMLVPDERTLDATLRQLNQFGYDLDRLQFVAQDEVEIFNRVSNDYLTFIAVVAGVESIRADKVAEGREIQVGRAGALAAERLMPKARPLGQAMVARTDEVVVGNNSPPAADRTPPAASLNSTRAGTRSRCHDHPHPPDGRALGEIACAFLEACRCAQSRRTRRSRPTSTG
jgi:hypothetical protein